MTEITEDRLLGGRVRLLQPAGGYRAAIDPVFLAASVAAQPGQSVLDVGLGVGAASLCLAARVAGLRGVGLELQPELAVLAERNVVLNERTDTLAVVQGDLQSAAGGLLLPGSFDHVMTNPPYMRDGTAPPHGGKSLANREAEIDLSAWMGFCVSMLRHKGGLAVVHRADRLDDLLAALHGRVGEIAVFPLWPKQGRAAKRVLVRARKGLRGPLSLLPGLVLHDEDGGYTAAAQAVLRDGAGLD
jgi:tRNA1(Val) A37 N6-methylase TrmN6